MERQPLANAPASTDVERTTILLVDYDADRHGSDEALFRILLKHVRSRTCLPEDMLPIDIPSGSFAFWILFRQRQLRKNQRKLHADSKSK